MGGKNQTPEVANHLRIVYALTFMYLILFIGLSPGWGFLCWKEQHLQFQKLLWVCFFCSVQNEVPIQHLQSPWYTLSQCFTALSKYLSLVDHTWAESLGPEDEPLTWRFPNALLKIEVSPLFWFVFFLTFWYFYL